MRAWCIGVLALASLGCRAGAYACTDDASCRDGERVGTCEPTGGCSFPDPACPSGRRYGTHAPNGLAGECVVDDVAGTGSSEAGSTSGAPTTSAGATTTSTANSGEASTASPTDSGDESSSGRVETSTNPIGESSSSEGGSSGDPYGSCMDAECPSGAECSPVGALPQTCAPPCQTDGDCPPPLDASFEAKCEGGPQEEWCMIPCIAQSECPDGMVCSDWQRREFGLVCTWF